VRREQGRGTFVSKPKLDHGPRELTSFSQEMRRHRLTATSRVLERGEAGASEQIAAALEVSPETPVFVLKRLRMADGEPVGIQTAYIPLALAPGIGDENLENVSLYEILQTRWGLQPSNARETYFAVSAEAQISSLLRIAPASPIFAVERVTSLASGKPFEFVQSFLRGGRYNVVLELAANRAPQATREGGLH
jgi:GntR family transcriptional regulator